MISDVVPNAVAAYIRAASLKLQSLSPRGNPDMHNEKQSSSCMYPLWGKELNLLPDISSLSGEPSEELHSLLFGQMCNLLQRAKLKHN